MVVLPLIFFYETGPWLHLYLPSLFKLSKHTMIRTDLEVRRGGGVSLYRNNKVHNHNIRHDMKGFIAKQAKRHS